MGEAAAGQADLAEQGGQRDAHPDGLLAVAGALQRRSSTDTSVRRVGHRTGRGRGSCCGSEARARRSPGGRLRLRHPSSPRCRRSDDRPRRSTAPGRPDRGGPRARARTPWPASRRCRSRARWGATWPARRREVRPQRAESSNRTPRLAASLMDGATRGGPIRPSDRRVLEVHAAEGDDEFGALLDRLPRCTHTAARRRRPHRARAGASPRRPRRSRSLTENV